MESAYILANKELEKIRKKNREKQDIRHSEVQIKAPEIVDIQSNLMKQGTRLLGCVLNRGEDFEDIKKAKIEDLVGRGLSERDARSVYEFFRSGS